MLIAEKEIVTRCCPIAAPTTEPVKPGETLHVRI